MSNSANKQNGCEMNNTLKTSRGKQKKDTKIPVICDQYRTFSSSSSTQSSVNKSQANGIYFNLNCQNSNRCSTNDKSYCIILPDEKIALELSNDPQYQTAI